MGKKINCSCLNNHFELLNLSTFNLTLIHTCAFCAQTKTCCLARPSSHCCPSRHLPLPCTSQQDLFSGTLDKDTCCFSFPLCKKSERFKHSIYSITKQLGTEILLCLRRFRTKHFAEACWSFIFACYQETCVYSKIGPPPNDNNDNLTRYLAILGLVVTCSRLFLLLLILLLFVMLSRLCAFRLLFAFSFWCLNSTDALLKRRKIRQQIVLNFHCSLGSDFAAAASARLWAASWSLA